MSAMEPVKLGDRSVEESRDAVKLSSQLLRKAIAAGELKAVLKHAALLTHELRTNALTPKSYYDLYLEATEALSPLTPYFAGVVARGEATGAELYESVQHAGNVIPRLYLLVLAGAACVRSGQTGPLPILADLLQMVKGVQHPQRGLFLRYFVISTFKDLLPEGSQAAVEGSVTFLCDFLVEMTRLWTRMGSASSSTGPGGRNKKKRERERQELRLLVGSVLTRLAKMESLTFTHYSTLLLPRLLHEIVESKDKLAQAYLLDVTLQVFPLEWHFATLTSLLAAVRGLVPDHATVKAVIRSLLTRIEDGTAAVVSAEGMPAPGQPHPDVPECRSTGLPADVDIFGSLLQTVTELASDTSGPFRGGSPRTGAEEAAAFSRGGEGDLGAEVTSAAVPAAAPAHPRLMALRDAHTALSAQEALASFLEVIVALHGFAVALYPGHTLYVDRLLEATGRVLHDVLALGEPPSVQLLAAEAGAGKRHPMLALPEPASATTSLSDAAALALLRILEGAAPVTPLTALELTRGRGRGMVDRRGTGVQLDEVAARIAVDLLISLQESLGLRMLTLSHYADVLEALPPRSQREVASKLLFSVIEGSSRLTDAGEARRLFAALTPLTREEEGDSGDAPISPAAQSEQAGMAKLVRLLGAIGSAEDGGLPSSTMPLTNAAAKVEADLRVLGIALDALSWAGAARVAYTFPALGRSTAGLLEVVGRLETAPGVASAPPAARKALGESVFALLHATGTALAVSGHAEAGMGVFLDAAGSGVAHGSHGAFAYECFARAFLLHESLSAADSRRGARALRKLLMALATSRHMSEAEYEGLAQRAVVVAARTPRTDAAVRLLLAASGLFWRAGQTPNSRRFERPTEVLACLQRAVRLADACLPPSPILFTDILNAYAGHAKAGVSGIGRAEVEAAAALASAHAAHYSPAEPRVASFAPSPLLSSVASLSIVGAEGVAVDPRAYLASTMEAVGLGAAISTAGGASATSSPVKVAGGAKGAKAVVKASAPEAPEPIAPAAEPSAAPPAEQGGEAAAAEEAAAAPATNTNPSEGAWSWRRES